MPWYRVGGTLMHLKLGGKPSTWPKACAGRIWGGTPTTPSMRCCAMSEFLCDHPMEGGGTCDAPICADCATAAGPDRHLCPLHAGKGIMGRRPA